MLNDWQRNIDTVRVANKTTMRFENTTIEFGVFGVDRHLMHPIFQWLDYRYRDYGGFARVDDDRVIGGYRNRFVAGVNMLNGTIDAKQYRQLPAAQGRAAVVAAAEAGELFGLCGELVLLPAERRAASRGRNISTRCAIRR